ncbi:hypothetical protein CRYUN_Cryun14cG0008000 [Craigia yunnanensis]
MIISSVRRGKKCAQRDPNLSYNFCVTSLQAAPKSHCADDLRELDHACMIALIFISDAIPTTKEAIDDYKSKNYDDANIDVSSVMDASTTCEDGSRKKKVRFRH